MFRFDYRLTFVLLGFLSFAAQAERTVLTLHPVGDATLYESADGDRADGAGPNLFAGRTGQGTQSTRRALVRFDLSAIPSDAELISAELTMNFRSSNKSERQFDLHRLIGDWSEGPAASVSGGQGVQAAKGDVTWLHRDNPSTAWDTLGGDFSSSPSSSLLVGATGDFTWASNAALLSDIERWTEAPEQNFGWIILGDETQSRTVMQIASRSNPDLALRPSLAISYDQVAVPEPNCLSVMLGLLFVPFRQATTKRRR